MKKRLILVLTVFMVFAFAAGTIAAPALQSITASLAGDINFKVNGNDWQAKDADGSVMAPIVYNDRTYLPVRAIGEALNVKVDWNADTRTVILGEAPVAEEPVVEEPAAEEPVVEKPAAPVAELAISPASVDLNKNALADVLVNITWGEATKITEITGLAKTSMGDVKVAPKEGSEYTVTDNGDGTGVLTVKANLAELLPVPITMVPDGTVLTLTVKFDSGEKTVDLKVVS